MPASALQAIDVLSRMCNPDSDATDDTPQAIATKDLAPLIHDICVITTVGEVIVRYTEAVAINFGYTFENIGIVVSAWLRKVNVTTYARYIFDYRALVGFRLTLEQLSAVNEIVTHNGNAYDVGFGQDFCAPIFDFLRTENRPYAWEVLRNTVLTKDPITY
ncbi:unnamed protein product [Alternaria alternata]